MSDNINPFRHNSYFMVQGHIHKCVCVCVCVVVCIALLASIADRLAMDDISVIMISFTYIRQLLL